MPRSKSTFIPIQFERVAHWFREVYPEPFEHPELARRLRVYDLIYRLADLQQRPDPLQIISSLDRRHALRAPPAQLERQHLVRCGREGVGDRALPSGAGFVDADVDGVTDDDAVAA